MNISMFQRVSLVLLPLFMMENLKLFKDSFEMKKRNWFLEVDRKSWYVNTVKNALCAC